MHAPVPLNPLPITTPAGLFFIDFDGTLLRSDGTLSPEDTDAIIRLKNAGIATVLATGRSRQSLAMAVPPTAIPVDYLIVSTGAGIFHHPAPDLISSWHLSPADTAVIIDIFIKGEIDFTVHQPVPDNHIFAYRSFAGENPDFHNRLSLYRSRFDCQGTADADFGPATQIVGILPPERLEWARGYFAETLPQYTVIRATSPLDHRSVWIEVFPSNVSKGKAAAWLADSLGVNPKHAFAVGNDYNDQDLLEWAGNAAVVANAPADLKAQFQVVVSHNENGVAEAASRWMAGNDFP